MKLIKWTILISCLFFAHISLSSSSEKTFIPPAVEKKVDAAIAAHQYKTANTILDNAIEQQPDSNGLYYKQALIQVDLENYPKAKTSLMNIDTPGQQKADVKKLMNLVDEKLSQYPKNEIGYEQDEAYVSDLDAYWTYIFLHYYRQTSYGKFGGHINYANRYGTSGEQYVLEGYPRFGKSNYLALNLGYASESQSVWPTRLYYIEPFITLPNNFEGSVGFREIKAINRNIVMETVSLGRYIGNYFIWARPMHFSPKSSVYGELGLRRYFDDKFGYFGIKVGAGRIPDIADFAPLNEIIILNAKAINIEYQTAIAKNLYLKLMGGYTHQDFPSGLIRNITDGYINLSWQF